MRGKKGVIWKELMPWIIGIFVLIIIFGLYSILAPKGLGIIDYIKDFFKFG